MPAATKEEIVVPLEAIAEKIEVMAAVLTSIVFSTQDGNETAGEGDRDWNRQDTGLGDRVFVGVIRTEEAQRRLL